MMMMLMMSGWHIMDKLWPMRVHGSMLLYVHRNHKAHSDGEPRTATSTLTQLTLNQPCPSHCIGAENDQHWRCRQTDRRAGELNVQNTLTPVPWRFYGASRSVDRWVGSGWVGRDREDRPGRKVKCACLKGDNSSCHSIRQLATSLTERLLRLDKRSRRKRTRAHTQVFGLAVWQKDLGSNALRLSFLIKSCGLWTLSLTINEALKWPSSLPILIQESFWWWQNSNRYIIYLSRHLRTHSPPFSPSLISLVVSVDVKHHVYLLFRFPPVSNKPPRFCGRKATCWLTSVG